MELKPGYKQTEVGVIPEDWEVKSIAQIAPLQRGFDLPSSELKDGPYPVVYSNGVMTFHDCAMARGPGVVTGRSGTIGKVHYIGTDYWPHNTSLWVTRFNGNDQRFVYYLYCAIGFERFASGSGVPTLNRNDAHAFFTALPPTKAEQAAIAEALSDADDLIESLEQLLAKKRQLKQGAMQELLTGKRRLPGFSGEWEVKRLDGLGIWAGGMTPSMRNQGYWQNGTVPWVSSGDVKSSTLTSTAFSISEYAVKRKAAPVLPAKSIIVVTRSGILRKYLPVAMNMIPMAINQDIKALLPNGYVLPEYLLHSLVSNGERILARCLKSGTTVESIEFPWLKAFTIPIPTLREQSAIAAVLTDMDAEIAALEAKLAKARQLKQGMMQELLTGRIRLV